MKYRMLVMDMDGTLLNNNKEVSERNRTALKKAAELGVRLVVSTGRIFTSARVYASLIGAAAPIIASNGAYIREKERNEVIYEKNMDRDVLYSLIEIIERYGFNPHLFTYDTIYTKKLINFSMNYYNWNESLPENERVKIKLVDSYDEAVKNGRILKVTLAADNTELLRKLRDELNTRFDLSIMSSALNNLEIMSSGISKGNAVKMLADYYGFNSDEIICIGDNENDISMIKFAGLGVAMGNATDDLKSAADYVTDTNENDGVADVIEKFIINQY